MLEHARNAKNIQIRGITGLDDISGGTFLISSSIKYCNNLHRRVSGVGSGISTPILLMTLESADKQPRAYCIWPK